MSELPETVKFLPSMRSDLLLARARGCAHGGEPLLLRDSVNIQYIYMNVCMMRMAGGKGLL